MRELKTENERIEDLENQIQNSNSELKSGKTVISSLLHYHCYYSGDETESIPRKHGQSLGCCAGSIPSSSVAVLIVVVGVGGFGEREARAEAHH